MADAKTFSMATAIGQSAEDALYGKVLGRIVPALFLAYIVSYLDRVSIGFAKAQMMRDIGMNDQHFAIGASLFFWSYMLFETPSNLILQKVGARVWIARIMISWGIVSMLFAFATSVPAFYGLRLLLGICEAGFFPGVIYFATRWLPSSRVGTMTSMFMVALPISMVLGAPASGLILDGLDGWHGLHGWQWLFLIEGFPAVLVGFAILRWLDDEPSKASWLSAEEAARLSREVSNEASGKISGIATMLKDVRVYALMVAFILFNTAVYAFSFWLPSILKAAGGLTDLQTGMLTVIPFLFAAFAMRLNARAAEKSGHWKLHGAISALAAGIALAASVPFAGNLWVSLALMTVAVSGTLSLIPLYWMLPVRLLTGTAAAAGLALVNSVGSFAGILGALIIGYVGQTAGVYVMAGFLVVYALLFFVLSSRVQDKIA